MKTRLITSAVGILVLLGVMALFDTFVFEAVIAVITLIGLHEIYRAFQFEKGGKLVFGGFALYALTIMFSGYGWMRVLILPISFVFVVYIACCTIWYSQTLNFAKLGGMVLFGGAEIFCFYSFIYLKQHLPQELYGADALYFIFLILGFAWGGDSAAYFTGRFFGKHKLAPVVSPHKTVEGAVGGVAGSILLGVLFTAIYAALAGRIQGLAYGEITGYHYLAIGVLAAVGSVLGILGDLFASAVKRQCGIKDYGTIFPGHGGIMDRFDSVMFIAPFVAMGVTAAFYFR